MKDERTGPRVSDMIALDLTEGSLYRSGFPHALFTRLRHEAPVWWHAAPERFAGGRIEVLGPPVYSALGIYSPILVAPRELPVHLS